MASKGAKDLRELAEEKEKELQLLREQHALLLEGAVREVREQLMTERARLRQLQDDFEYNLGLLEQRDRELVSYETALAEVKRVVGGMVGENSELRVQLENTRAEVAREREGQTKVKQYYLNRIEQHQKEMDAYRLSIENEVEKERVRVEGVERELRERMVTMETELALQRKQVTAEFDAISRKREREYREREEELNKALLTREGQLRELSRELQLAKTAAKSQEEEAGSKAMEVGELEKQLQRQRWESSDALSAKEARVAELEGLLEQADRRAREQQAAWEQRRAELDRLARERESTLRAAQEVYREREMELEQRVREVEEKLEEQEREVRRMEWAHSDAVEEKQREIERLREEVADCKMRGKAEQGELSREVVAKDLQICSLEVACEEAKAKLARGKEDAERYQRELSLAVERERSLEQAKAQLELDWQQRLGQVDREQYQRHQAIINTLTTARDEALAQCKELESEVQRERVVSAQLQQERDIAIASLQRNSLGGGRGKVGEEVGEGVGDSLEQQNAELRRVIHQMRQAMEQLMSQSREGGGGEEKSAIGAEEGEEKAEGGSGRVLTSGYVKFVEGEVARVRAENRKLRERVQELSASHKPPTPPEHRPSSSSSSERHKSHLVALSETIAGLQREKAVLEVKLEQAHTQLEHCKQSTRKQQEQVYLLKAMSVPPCKLQQKLLKATQVIIALVREREALQQGQRPPNRHKSQSTQTFPPKETQSSSNTQSPSHPHPPHSTQSTPSSLHPHPPHSTQSTPSSSHPHPPHSINHSNDSHETTVPEQPKAASTPVYQPSPSPPPSVHLSVSSDDPSLQQVFQLLDAPLPSSPERNLTPHHTHSSPPPPPPPPPPLPSLTSHVDNHSHAHRSTSPNLTLKGMAITSEAPARTRTQRERERRAKQPLPLHRSRPKIRNYNIKED